MQDLFTRILLERLLYGISFNNETSISKNLFVVDYKSFLSNQHSSISIETLTEVKAILFTLMH